MFGIHGLPLFIAAGLLLNITPGPDTLFVAGSSAAQGWRAGAAAALGVGAGCIIHTLAAAIGLSALLAASTEAFAAVKIVGAVYLAYVGIRLVFSSGGEGGQAAESRRLPSASLRRVFVRGCMTNALNPKVALFFLAFLPQFVAPDAPSKTLAFLLLGAIFNLTGTSWNLGVAVFSARVAQGLRRGSSWVVWFNRGVGAMFVYIGARLVYLRPV